MKPKRAKEHFILLFFSFIFLFFSPFFHFSIFLFLSFFSFFLLLRTFDNIEYLPSHPPMLERMLVLEYE